MRLQRSFTPRGISARVFAQIGACVMLLLLVIISATATVSAPQTALATLTPSRLSSPSRTPSPKATATSTRARATPTSMARRIAPQSVHGQPQVDEHTVALYHFDTPDTVAIDATGRYTGTLVGNAVTGVPSLYDGVLSLDGNGAYVRTGYLGDLSQGTIEVFVDFSTACATSWDFTIISAGGEFGSNQPVLVLRQQTGLMFGIYAEGRWRWADSGINACRYLNEGHSRNPPPWEDVPVLWPYETWRFHHVAGTWGPRGMEIWVDGVLHGLGNEDPNAGYYPYPWMCNPQEQEMSVSYPNCDSPHMAPPFPPGDYTGGLPPYSTFLIGCDSAGSCFKGRIDEVRISNVQRTFHWSVVPTVTPTPTQTPVPITGEYAVDSQTLALYHLNAQNASWIFDEVTQTWNAGLAPGAAIVSGGRFGGALLLNGNGAYAHIPNNISPNGTIEMWVNLSSIPNHFAIFSAGNTNGSDTIYLGINRWLGQTLVLTVYDADMNAYTVDSGFRPIAGCWHHVAGTWGTRGLQIWVDGTLRGTYGYYGAPSNGYEREWIGCTNRLECIQGLVDEVRKSSVQRSFTRASLARHASVMRTPVPWLPGATGGENRLYLPLIWAAPTASLCPNY